MLVGVVSAHVQKRTCAWEKIHDPIPSVGAGVKAGKGV